MSIKLPHEFSIISPQAFILKLIILCSLVTVVGWMIISAPGLGAIPTQMILGVLFAHAVELQHQCLHNTAFHSRRLNRFIGFVLGVPMLVSYAHYCARHLEHHKWLGTSHDVEFFSYRRDSLHSWWALLRQAYSLHRYRTVLEAMSTAIQGRQCPDARTPEEGQAIQSEYRLFAGLIVGVGVVSILSQSLLAVQLWLLPLLLSAEAAHYLIELPEHFRCDTTTRNLWRNTRTIGGSWFSFWLTNGNNFHVEHHLNPRAAIDLLPEIHKLVVPYLEVQAPSYWAFFSGLVTASQLVQEHDSMALATVTVIYEEASRCWHLTCQESPRQAYFYRLDALPENVQIACEQAQTMPAQPVNIALPGPVYRWIFR